MTPSEPPKKSVDAALDFGRYAGLGLQFVVTLALLGGLGWWLDSKLGSTPWLLVLGTVLGSVLAFYLVVRSVPAPTHGSKDKTPTPPRS